MNIKFFNPFEFFCFGLEILILGSGGLKSAGTEKLLQKKRAIIEAINGELKNIAQVENIFLSVKIFTIQSCRAITPIKAGSIFPVGKK